jgi:hypothetical protein
MVIMSIFKEKIRYPEKDDKFFIDSGQQEELALLYKAFQEFGNYADSYRTGALSLIDSAFANRGLRDYLIYPIIFLIRHYVELRLKELIQGLNYCKEQNRKFPIHHDIQNLWQEFKTLYSNIGENVNDIRFSYIDDLIKELSSVDPISMAFRYPVDTTGQKTQKLQSVNLKNLQETFIRVCFVFDGVAMQISHYVSITEDMMQDVYRDYWQ